MVRFCVRVFISPLVLAAINLLLLIPLVLAIVDVSINLGRGQAADQALIDVVEGMGVLLIGWGVAIEERRSLREIFRLTGASDEARQGRLDEICHAAGLGLLIFGLFAEMCIEGIRIPNHILNTEGINEVVLGISLLFMAICVWILGRSVVGIVAAGFFASEPFAAQPSKPH
jgi:hypothetical protein